MGLYTYKVLKPVQRAFENLNINTYFIKEYWASLVAQMVKNLSTMQETRVRSLNWEDPVEEGMAMHSSLLTWRILRDREAWWAAFMGSQRVPRHAGHD